VAALADPARPIDPSRTQMNTPARRIAARSDLDMVG
jgi:hypothetical protein